MAELYTWPAAARLLLTFLIALTVLFQTLAAVLSFSRRRRSYRRVLENHLEIALLLQVLTASLLHGQVMQGYESSLIAPTGYGALHIAVFALLLLMAVAVLAAARKPWPLLVILASGLTLPPVEAVFGNIFAYLYLAEISFFLGRSVYISIRRYREIRTELSALSIKNMIDSLHTGLLFSEPDGFILLVNARMQQLMQTVTGQVYRNAKQFYERLLLGDLENSCQKANLEGQVVCLLPDESAWMFTQSVLEMGRKKNIQFTATDITRRWALTVQLWRQERELREKGAELNRAISRLHILARERETQKAKMRAHDVLGQRLSLLLRTLRSEQALDYDLLRFLSQGLLDDLKAEEIKPSPQKELASLQQLFGSIGVAIELQGELPEDPPRGHLFTDIIKKSVTNAVHHGFATKIEIHSGFSKGRYRLKVSNNGRTPRRTIIEGGGIGGIRKAIEPYGGVLTITTGPRFVLTVDLPGGENDLQGADCR